MRRQIAILMTGILIFGVAAPAYAVGPLEKLGRGLTNTATGFLEVLKNIHEVSIENDPVTGLVWGSTKGSAFAVGRTGVGVYEVTTFVFPKYEPILKPEFVY